MDKYLCERLPIFLSGDDLLNLRDTQFHVACEWFGLGWTHFVATDPCCPTTVLGFVRKFDEPMEFGR